MLYEFHWAVSIYWFGSMACVNTSKLDEGACGEVAGLSPDCTARVTATPGRFFAYGETATRLIPALSPTRREGQARMAVFGLPKEALRDRPPRVRRQFRQLMQYAG